MLYLITRTIEPSTEYRTCAVEPSTALLTCTVEPSTTFVIVPVLYCPILGLGPGAISFVVGPGKPNGRTPFGPLET